jgi:hypothetical protein
MNPMENPTPDTRGSVLATVEPSGPKTTSGRREHVLQLRLELSAADVKRGGSTHVTSVAHSALTGFVAKGEACAFADVPSKKPGGKITAIEGTLALCERPSDGAIEHLCSTLRIAGYGVTIRETRECDQSGCASTVAIGWNRSSGIPSGWYDRTICGKHAYKRCVGCQSTYAMTSTNATGPAPSLHCEVCGTILVEWGGTKLWNAELVSNPVASD